MALDIMSRKVMERVVTNAYCPQIVLDPARHSVEGVVTRRQGEVEAKAKLREPYGTASRLAHGRQRQRPKAELAGRASMISSTSCTRDACGAAAIVPAAAHDPKPKR